MDEKSLEEPAARIGNGRPVEPIPDVDDEGSPESIQPGRNDGGTEPTEPPATWTTWTDKTLDFLAHASNETLGACLVGLGATTYLILGRVGLVIIGVAGGVVLHATWEGIRGDDRDEQTKKKEVQRRREAGVEVMRRVLEWRSTRMQDESTTDIKMLAHEGLDYSRFGPDTSKALGVFTDAVMKDYVYYWYGPTLPGEEAFPSSCRQTFTSFVLSLSSHLQRKRPADAFLDFVTNASSIIIVLLNELAAAVNASPNHSTEEAISAYLQMKPDSSLSYIVNEKAQNAKLGDIAEDILQAYLDSKAYNCAPVHVFLKKIMAELVLGSTVTLCSRPEWINEWIVYGLEESETTKNVMDMVDAGVDGRSTDKGPAQRETIKELPTQRQEVLEKQDIASVGRQPPGIHRRESSKAEEAMDEAMREAKELTRMMMEEDERRAREERERQTAMSSSEDVSDANTQGAPTPTSSQSDRERQDEETPAVATTNLNYATGDIPTSTNNKQAFTSFDQLVSVQQPTALMSNPEKTKPEPAQLTLHNATISIFDDSEPGERASIKARPQADYLIQIEPSSNAFTGWMIARKYADFEMLHEVLRRISVITGVFGFTESHAELPKWRVHTKASLRTELERYLTDAVRFPPLAESEGMKRFLEKDQGLNKSPSANKSFGWPTPDAFGKFGGDMMSVLTKAPKQVAGGVTGGGKAVFGGVAGLVGGVAGKKPSPSPANLSRTSTSSTRDGHKARPSVVTSDSFTGTNMLARQSNDSLRTPSVPSIDRRPSGDTSERTGRRASTVQTPQRASFESSRTGPARSEHLSSPVPSESVSSPFKRSEDISLPPPPSEMPEDYGSPTRSMRASTDTFRSSAAPPRFSQSNDTEAAASHPPVKAESKPKEPISEEETSVAVELMFAVVTELYTLSSVWNIRRTLLTAAKSYLLRPGNPQLTSIRDLLQDSMLDSNLSDEGLAGHIYKMRENALPTEEETEVWKRDYPEKSDEQKEELRIKARHLLVTRGMPQALSSVMGAGVSGEALGKVFDCLQLPEVSRGLVFGLMLQALRVVTH